MEALDGAAVGLALGVLLGRSCRRIMSVNSALILLGLFGVLPPATTALIHNPSTILFSVKNMQSLPLREAQ